MTGGKIHPTIKCHHRDGRGKECGGDIMLSHVLADENKTYVYTCVECGGRVNVT